MRLCFLADAGLMAGIRAIDCRYTNSVERRVRLRTIAMILTRNYSKLHKPYRKLYEGILYFYECCRE